jgi:hypothetical protein
MKLSLTKLDRRIIFVAVLFLVVLTTLFPVNIPVYVTNFTKDVYGIIQSQQQGSLLLIEVDMQLRDWPERGPQLAAVTQHVINRHLDVIFFADEFPEAALVTQRVLSTVDKRDWKYGINYVDLGYFPGRENSISSLLNEPEKLVQQDYHGTPRGQLPILARYKNGEDVSVYITCSTDVPDIVVRQWTLRFKKPLIYLASAGASASVMPYLATGQVTAMLIGITGAAEYETLAGTKGVAARMGDALSSLHILMLALIVGVNIHVFSRHRPKEGARS